MKIAFVSDLMYPFNIGGIEIRNYELAKGLVKKGHEVHMFGIKLWDGKDVIKKQGIIIHGINCRSDYSLTGKRTIKEAMEFALRLPRHLLKERFDIIDVATCPFFHCFSCKLVSIIMKSKLVLTWNGYLGDYWNFYLGKEKGRIAKLIEKLSSKLSNFNIAVSEKTKQLLVNDEVKIKNVKVIYNGIDLNDIRKVKGERRKGDVIFVGRLAHQKNLPLLIEGVKLVKEKYPKIKVCIVGDGSERKKILMLIKKYNLEKNVQLRGELKKRSEVFRAMKESKVFVLPSLWEGFPLVVIEAGACGLPVISVNSRMNNASEFIKKNGIIVENNPLAFSEGIRKLLDNEGLRKKIGQEGVKFSEKLEWKILAKELEEYYLGLIKNNQNIQK